MLLFPLFANKDLKALILNINITEAGKKNRKAAIKLMRELTRHVTKPGVACTDDGKVSFFWAEKRNQVDLEVQTDGVSYKLNVLKVVSTPERYEERRYSLDFTLADVRPAWVQRHLAPFLHPQA